MNNNMKKFLPFIVIVVIAAFLRLYQLGIVPPSPDWDETALGYNAYSILKTGRDEYGTFLPLTFRSFDDYKPPLYVYLTVPSVALFGLSLWSTRLPSALMGILAVIGTYFLVKELFIYRHKTMSSGRNEDDRRQTASDRKKCLMLNVPCHIFDAHCSPRSEHIRVGAGSLSPVTCMPLLSAALLALSPWHIQFSRIAFEANSGVTLNIWAVTMFLAGFRKKIYFPISAALFGLGMYAYHSERVFLPLMVCLLLIVYWKKLMVKENAKTLCISVIVGLLVFMPLVPVLFNKTSVLRLRGTSSFREQTEILSNTIKKLEYDRAHGYILGEFFDNRRVEYTKIIIRGYLVHFSPKWLFVAGDHERHHGPDMGLLYLWELPFLLLGIFSLLRTRNQDTGTKLLIGWLLISPIAASPTTQLPHAIRTLVFLPTFQIFIAYGIVVAVSSIKYKVSSIKKVVNSCLLLIVFCLIAFNILYYFAMYFGRTNQEYSKFWQYGYKEAVLYTEFVKDKYEKIVVSTNLEQPYMFFLFFTKYDPVKYLSGGGTKSGNFAENRNSFDKYIFRPFDWRNENFDGKTLYVGNADEMPHGNNAHIPFLDGTPAIEIKDRMD